MKVVAAMPATAVALTRRNSRRGSGLEKGESCTVMKHLRTRRLFKFFDRPGCDEIRWTARIVTPTARHKASESSFRESDALAKRTSVELKVRRRQDCRRHTRGVPRPVEKKA